MTLRRKNFERNVGGKTRLQRDMNEAASLGVLGSNLLNDPEYM
jgi:hypothetical protein